MTNKTVYSFSRETRIYIGPVTLDKSDMSPLEKNVFLVPGNCLEEMPPTAPLGMQVVEHRGEWKLEDIPVNPVSQTTIPTVEQRIAALKSAIAFHLDAFAQTKGYDNIINAALRAAYPGPFHEEGIQLAQWMDACWSKGYELLARWSAGEITEPTGAELIALLPPTPSLVQPESHP